MDFAIGAFFALVAVLFFVLAWLIVHLWVVVLKAGVLLRAAWGWVFSDGFETVIAVVISIVVAVQIISSDFKI